MQLFAVLATHTPGGTGPITHPLIVTENVAVALTAALGAEEKGYRFVNDGDGVQVFRLKLNDVYAPRQFLHGDAFLSMPHTFVYYRVRHRETEGGWLIAWPDPEIEKMYRRVFDSVAV